MKKQVRAEKPIRVFKLTTEDSTKVTPLPIYLEPGEKQKIEDTAVELFFRNKKRVFVRIILGSEEITEFFFLKNQVLPE